MNSYERKQEAKRERYEALAEKADAKSDALHKQSRETVAHIPLGQPILVGHHSERAHRNTLDRSWNQLGKAVAESEKADYYRRKAAGVGTGGISSDDPEAVQKLKKKLAGLVEFQENMKAANKIVKAKKLSDDEKIEKLIESGYKDADARELLKPDFCGRVGFASYSLSNNNAEIRRVKKRIEDLEAVQDDETTEREVAGVTVVDNVEENRVQLFFPGKPSQEVRTALKQNGFRWSRYNGCWQAYRSALGWKVDNVLKLYQEIGG